MALDTNRIENTVTKLRKVVKKAAKEPTPEQVHHLRTRIRRVEAMFNALRLAGGGDGGRALKLLKGVRKRAGKVRDMDVLTSYASGMHVEGEEECLVRLLERLGAERYKQAEKLQKMLESRGPKIRRSLKQTSAELEELFAGDGANRQEPLVVEQTAAAGLRLSKDLADPPVLSRRNLHRYRLRVKELQYVLQMNRGEANRNFIRSLGEVKDAIGEWHDWEELTAIAAEATDHANCKLIQKFKETSQGKYQSGLAAANRMRAAYLQISSRNTKRRATGKPAPLAVIAVSKIAA